MKIDICVHTVHYMYVMYGEYILLHNRTDRKFVSCQINMSWEYIIYCVEYIIPMYLLGDINSSL